MKQAGVDVKAKGYWNAADLRLSSDPKCCKRPKQPSPTSQESSPLVQSCIITFRLRDGPGHERDSRQVAGAGV